LFFIELGIFIAIIIMASAAAKYFFGTGHQKGQRAQAGSPPQSKLNLEQQRLQVQERTEARALYERLVREKLEVIKDAVAMGYAEADLHRLDKRLAELIGEQQLKQLLSDDPELPQATDDLKDTDLLAEADRLKRKSETE